MIMSLVMLSSIGLHAQTDQVEKAKGDKPVFELGDIVVTATRKAMPLEDAPVKVTVIEKEEIENTPELTLGDFLRRVPDITLAKSHWTECAPREITLRGVSSQERTLVLLDGIPLNGTMHGWTSLSHIPKDAVERVEIVRGPMSALYGSGAMGGVVNILTKVPKKSWETSFKSGYGSMDTRYTELFQSGGTDEVKYYFGGRYYDTGGYIAAKNPHSYNRENKRAEWSMTGRLMWYPDDVSSLKLGFGHSDESVDRGRIFTHHDYVTRMVYLTYARENKDGISVEGSLYKKFQDWKVNFDLRPTYSYLYLTENHDLEDYGQLFKISYPISNSNTLTAGIDSQAGKIKKTDVYPTSTREALTRGKQSMVSFFMQDEMEISKRMSLTVGARGDFSESYDGRSYDSNPAPHAPVDEYYESRKWDSISPKAGLRYHLNDNTTLRTSVGKAFAAPSLPKLYTVMQRGPILVYGNPELDPETSVSYELGVEHWFTDQLQGGLSMFHTDGDDFISMRSTGALTRLYDNITKVKIQGIESELNYDFARKWTMFVGHSYNRSVIKTDSANPANDSNALPFTPRHKGRVGFTYRDSDRFSGDLSFRYMGKRYTDIENTSMLDEYVTIDLSLSKKCGKYTTFTIGAENILDIEYDLYGIPDDESKAPGRVVMMSVSYEF